MKIHELKTWIEYFNLVRIGAKNFEVRKYDRDFKEGDELLLKEWDNEKQEFTGRILHRKIDYILIGGQFGIEEDFIVMAMSKL